MALGYKGRGAPKDSDEYLIAERGNELCLNLIDAEDPKYIPAVIMVTAVEEIQYHVDEGRKIFVHCNEGKSRAPGIVFLYLVLENMIGISTYEQAIEEFKKVYPLFEPAKGMYEYLKEAYAEYNMRYKGEARSKQD